MDYIFDLGPQKIFFQVLESKNCRFLEISEKCQNFDFELIFWNGKVGPKLKF